MAGFSLSLVLLVAFFVSNTSWSDMRGVSMLVVDFISTDSIHRRPA
jgi:hypothetical protein